MNTMWIVSWICSWMKQDTRLISQYDFEGLPFFSEIRFYIHEKP